MFLGRNAGPRDRLKVSDFMPHEVLALGDGYHAYIDRAIQEKIKQLVKRYWTPMTGGSIEQVQDEILARPYLRLDEWAAVAYRERLDRWKRAEQTLAGFKQRLAKGEIDLRGVEGTTGQTAITVEKLQGRAVPHLDVAPAFLLIELERHPKGSETVQDHYWLYSQKQRWAELLRPIDDVKKLKLNNPLSQDPSGDWHPMDRLRGEFYRLVESRFGHDARNDFKRVTTFQLLQIASPSSEILAECQRLTGFDCLANERRLSTDAETRYEKKYGPKKTWQPGYELFASKGIHLHTVPMEPLFRQFTDDVKACIAAYNNRHKATHGAVVLVAKDMRSFEVSIPGATLGKSVHVSLDVNQLEFRSEEH